MRRVLVIVVISVLALMLAMAVVGPVSAGQPNQSCEAAGAVRPGHSSTAPGSAFNPDGVAGTHYAGEQPQNSKNPNSVSQYDVACFGGSNP
jgi:hypothetical protein